MAERNLEGMINNNKLTDSGNYSLGGSSEILSFEDSPPPNSNEANFKAKMQELAAFRTSLQDQQNYKKARKVRFYRNGDKSFPGLLVAISPDKYKNMAALMKELTRVLSTSMTLMDGVRAIYDLEGNPIREMDMLLEGESYVAASKEHFQFLEYEAVATASWNNPTPKSKANAEEQSNLSSFLNEKCNIEDNRDFIRPRTITLVQNGNPRSISRLLLNKKTAFSFEQVVRDINDTVKLNAGAVRKVYNVSGKPMNKLSDFFEHDEIFIACGPEKLKKLADEDLAYINERMTVGSKSPLMARRKSIGSKSPLLGRKSPQPGLASPKSVRRNIDQGSDFSPLKVLDSKVPHEEF
ncbi:neuronal migration protein doublecortin-like isoform X2 [Symsagittifera roscoffensis]